MYITHTRLWLTVGIVILVALIVVACGPQATQLPTATLAEPVATPSLPPTPTSEELVAEPTPPPTPTLEKPVAPSPAAASFEGLLTSAQEALKAGDQEKAREELEEALGMATGAQKDQLEDILADLEKGELEEVEEHLTEMLGGAGIQAFLREAQEALKAGDQEKVRKELEEALEMATGAQKDQLDDILADLEKGELEEVEEHLAAMVTGTESVTDLALAGVAAEGRELFKQATCNVCHGENAEGGFGPALAGRTGDLIFRQVRTPVGEMPPFSPDQVSDENLEKIAAFIETLPDERGLTGAALRHLQTALGELEAGDTDGALEAIAVAAERSKGQASDQIEEIADLLQEGSVDAAVQRAQALIGPGAARGFLEDAVEALEEGNLGKVKEELEEALEVAEGPTREAVQDIIQDLEKGDLEEVEEHLQELLGE